MTDRRAGRPSARPPKSLFALALAAAAATGLTAAAPAWAGGEGAQPLPPVSAAPRAAEDPSRVACVEAGVMAGTVSSVSGAVFAQAPGEDPRSLSCEDVVRACDRIFTGEDATVALMIDDVYVQLGRDAVMTVEAPRAQFFVHTGSARVIDTRDRDAEAFRLATPQLRSRGQGGDAEVRVGIALADDRSRLCSFGNAVAVSARGTVLPVAAGACVEVTRDAVSPSGAGQPTIALESALVCRREFAGLADRFLPTDVAAPPLPTSAFPPLGRPSALPPRISCDTPGSGCGGPPPPAPPSAGAVFRDPDPDLGGGFPGGLQGES